MIPGDFADKLFNSDFDFEKAALELFHHQVNHVDVYRSFVSLLHTNISGIQSINDIPYLPEIGRAHV